MSFKSWYDNTFSDEIAHESILNEAMRDGDNYVAWEPGMDISQTVALPKPRGDTFDDGKHTHGHHMSDSNGLLSGLVVGLGLTAMYGAAAAAAAYGYSKIKGRDRDMN